MDHLAQQIVDLIRTHPDLAAFLIGLTAFGESFAIISFFVPGTTILVAAGALVQTGALAPVPTIVAAGIGAVLGDAISYWVGCKFGEALPGMWPFRKHPAALERGVHFFRRYGWASVFIGRFFGPLRAFVPLAAGMCRMPALPFYFANIVSAVIWAPAVLYSGYLIGMVLGGHWSTEEKVAVLAVAALLAVLIAYGMRRLFQTR